MKHPSALAAALALAGHGMHVFPVGDTGIPLVAWGEAATDDPARIEAMWRAAHDRDRWRREASCVGIACGPSGIVVLDNDRDDGGDTWIGRAILDHGDEWLRTVTARTPSGGDHLYFDARGLTLKSTVGKRGGFFPGIDTRARGGMVLAPPSTTRRGSYAWLEGGALGESAVRPVPDFIARQIAAPPIPRRLPRGKETGTSERNTISFTSGPCILPSVTPEGLAGLDRDDAYVWAQASYLGIPAGPLGAGFLCVVHGDTHPSAALYRLDSGHVRYHDFHAQGQPEEWLTLAEVYAAQMSGKARKLAAPLHAVWQLRLLYEIGLVDPVEVTLPPLPERAFDSVRKAYEGFRLLCGLRWLAYPAREAVTYTPGFTAPWCGMAVETAKKAVRALVAMGIVAQVGTCPSAYGKRTSLLLPRESP